MRALLFTVCNGNAATRNGILFALEHDFTGIMKTTLPSQCNAHFKLTCKAKIVTSLVYDIF